MKTKTVSVAVLVVILATGCASRGEGLTIDSSGLNIGASLAQRDKIAEDKSNAELAQLRARTVIEQDKAAASIEQGAELGRVMRPVVLALGIGLAIGLLAIGVGYGGLAAAPLAAEGVAALRVRQEAQATRRLEVIMEIGPGGYSAKLLTAGYDPKEIAQIVKAAPALDAPRLQQLQERVGDHGMRRLVQRGELEETLKLIQEET